MNNIFREFRGSVDGNFKICCIFQLMAILKNLFIPLLSSSLYDSLVREQL